MTKRRRPTPRSRTSRTKTPPKKLPTKSLLRGSGLFLVAISALTLLSLLSLSRGTLTEGWITLLREAFGWGVYLVTLALGALGVWLFLRSFESVSNPDWERWTGMGILLLTAIGLFHAFTEDPVALAASGGGGGKLGLYILQMLTSSLGRLGMFVMLFTLAILGLVMAFDISTLAVLAQIRSLTTDALARYQAWRNARSSAMIPAPREPLSGPKIVSARRPAPSKMPLAETVRDKLSALKPARGSELVQPRVIGGNGSSAWHLPAISSILDEITEQDVSQSEIRHRARVIEETLTSFGVPGKVTEVNQGPTVTQFGVEPGYVERSDKKGNIRRAKVKVNRISALGKDLELALAASPIRIEAPVPGRSVVGIEVPNAQVSVVSLRGVMESDEFRNIREKGELAIGLGRDVSGQPIVADLAAMPHLLVAGATGSGKSACINSIITCLLCTHTPDDLRLILIDPKMVEMVNYNGIPHLLSPVVTDVTRVVNTLKWATREMDRRYKEFSAAGARNLQAFNKQLTARGEAPLPFIVILIDELADMMMVAPDEVERYVCRIAQMARATGIHLVIATQRPSVDVVTGLIKANFPARISFAVTSQVDSRVVLDTPGAEQLLASGDMLFMAPDTSKLARAQGCWVTDIELERLVRFWKGISLERPLPDDSALVQQPLWVGAAISDKADELDQDGDDLLGDATLLVCEQGRASISLLQRKLRIGYSRAARLIDLMEEKGVVGPSPGGSRPREVLIDADDVS